MPRDGAREEGRRLRMDKERRELAQCPVPGWEVGAVAAADGDGRDLDRVAGLIIQGSRGSRRPGGSLRTLLRTPGTLSRPTKVY